LDSQKHKRRVNEDVVGALSYHRVKKWLLWGPGKEIRNRYRCNVSQRTFLRWGREKRSKFKGSGISPTNVSLGKEKMKKRS